VQVVVYVSPELQLQRLMARDSVLHFALFFSYFFLRSPYISVAFPLSWSVALCWYGVASVQRRRRAKAHQFAVAARPSESAALRLSQVQLSHLYAVGGGVQKRALANVVIENAGTVSDLQSAVQKWWQSSRARATARNPLLPTASSLLFALLLWLLQFVVRLVLANASPLVALPALAVIGYAVASQFQGLVPPART
jgi:hypothetical protein